MKRILSLVVAVTIAWFIFQYFKTQPVADEHTISPRVTTGVVESLKEAFSGTEEAPKTESVPTQSGVSAEDIKLSSLNLKPEHEALLKKVGIDTATFIITKDMQLCAKEAVGAQRIAEFKAGDTPSLGEMTSLIPCLQ